MNDLFILSSLGSHVLDDATANAAAGEKRTLSVFARLATPRYLIRITNETDEQRCPTLTMNIAITRPHAARALRHDARRRSPVIGSWKSTSPPKRRRDAPRAAKRRARAPSRRTKGDLESHGKAAF
ncbi:MULTISPECIES: hypothetical protein [Burkholderia]|uniref:hypothetical protein n=1 Tax=Burkholderia TaxID=32008 RepID=UPI001E5AD741|nr:MULTISPECIES: hypothetical protein [Burkholderia]